LQKNAAESDVRKLYGVVGVINNIMLKQQPQPADIKMRIENALKRSADLEGKSIQVSVTDGTVTLDGTVQSWSARDQAKDAAWAAPGVREVRDNLQVAI
jgi:osmotically-inducible protein OsmY